MSIYGKTYQPNWAFSLIHVPLLLEPKVFLLKFYERSLSLQKSTSYNPVPLQVYVVKKYVGFLKIKKL